MLSNKNSDYTNFVKDVLHQNNGDYSCATTSKQWWFNHSSTTNGSGLVFFHSLFFLDYQETGLGLMSPSSIF